MKIRSDFVTNSSSSSFIIARTPELNDQQKEALLSLAESKFLGRKILAPEDSEERIQQAFGEWGIDYDEHAQRKARKALADGLTLYGGMMQFDEMEYQIYNTFQSAWQALQENADEEHGYAAIETELYY